MTRYNRVLRGKVMDLAERQKVNSYKFKKKSSEMSKIFGTIKKGNEDV